MGNNMFQSSLKPLSGNIQMSGGDGDGGEGGEDDDEEDGKLIDAPEVILKNSDDKDVVLHEVACKLYKFRADEKEWADLGKGTLRVTKDPDTNKQRITIRNTMGKILVNSYFFKNMNLAPNAAKNTIQFNALVFDPIDNKSSLGNFYVKLRPDDIQATAKALETGKASV
jgi:Ran-binding protein 1